MAKKKTVRKAAKKQAKRKAAKKQAKKREAKHFDPSWGGSDLPGGGSVFRRFFPNH